jgi:hypothetical protein
MALGCLPFCHKIGRCNVVEYHMGWPVRSRGPNSPQELRDDDAGPALSSNPTPAAQFVPEESLMHSVPHSVPDGSIRSPKGLICP